MSKDSPRTTAGELQKTLESRCQKTLKKMVKQHLHHHMLFGRVSRKIILTHPKTDSDVIISQTQMCIYIYIYIYTYTAVRSEHTHTHTHIMNTPRAVGDLLKGLNALFFLK